MTSLAHGSARLVRALALGFTCFSLGLGGHLLSGGPAPSVGAAALTVIPLGCLCMWATAKRCRLGSITALMVGSQLALHEAFMWLAGAQGCVLPTASGGHGEHPGGGHLAMHCAAAAPMGGMAHTDGGLTPVMVAAHLVAALGAALALAHGERLLWELAAAIGRPILARGHLPRLVVVGPFLGAYAAVRPVARIDAGPASGRGPPHWLTFTA